MAGLALFCWLLTGGLDVGGEVSTRVGIGVGTGIVMAFLLRALVPPRSRPGLFAQAVGHVEEPDQERPPALRDLDFAVRFATLGTGAYDVHYRLRPAVRELVAHRLLVGHDIELDREPAAARDLLGTQLWDLVRADRPAPEEKNGPGLALEDVVGMVDRMEEL